MEKPFLARPTHRTMGLSVSFLTLFLSFITLIFLLGFADVAPIGPAGTSVGLSHLNGAVRDRIGCHEIFKTLTDLLGFLLIAVFALFFFILAVRQFFLRGKKFSGVDADLYLLFFYCVMLGALYLLFEFCVVNFRPVMTGDKPEPSFPSSHTLLALSVLGVTVFQIRARVKRAFLRRVGVALSVLLAVLMTVLRLLSGVHWFTDILGGVLLGSALPILYALAVSLFDAAKEAREVPPGT